MGILASFRVCGAGAVAIEFSSIKAKAAVHFVAHQPHVRNSDEEVGRCWQRWKRWKLMQSPPSTHPSTRWSSGRWLPQKPRRQMRPITGGVMHDSSAAKPSKPRWPAATPWATMIGRKDPGIGRAPSCSCKKASLRRQTQAHSHFERATRLDD